MTNLEYLERVKNLSGLKEFLFGTECTNLEETFQIRKILALEIIAEELIKHNKNLGCIVTALENIDTDLRAR